MVFSVEPGLYIAGGRRRGAPEALRGIGVRIEDDVLITEPMAHENLDLGDPED